MHTIYSSEPPLDSYDRFIIPRCLRTTKNPLDLRVYLELCMLDPSRGEKVVELPPQDQLAKQCGRTEKPFVASLERLSKSGWINIVHIPGKTIRRRVIVKQIKDVPSIVMHELMSKDEGARSLIQAKKNGRGVDIIYTQDQKPSFPQTLIELHKGAHRIDAEGYALCDFPLEDLWRIAGYPTVDDLSKAIHGVELFDQPRAGKIYDIIAVFSSWFKQNAEGESMGVLSPRRHKKLTASQLPRSVQTKLSRAAALEEAKKRCTIRPTSEHSVELIDALCYDLNAGKSVLRGELPVSVLQLPCMNAEGSQVKLSDGVEGLVRVVPGHWFAQWHTVKKSNSNPPSNLLNRTASSNN